MKPRWAVLISGRGSNLAALLDLRDEVDLRLVMSSNPRAPGLLRARRAGVKTAITPFLPREVANVSGKRKGARQTDWTELDVRLRAEGISQIFLAGFMKVLPGNFVQKWQGRIINLHPSLLPAYPGLNSIARAHADCADMGVTVHEVTEEVDAGAVILQKRTLRGEDVRRSQITAETAEFLLHVDEQRAIREAIQKWKRVKRP